MKAFLTIPQVAAKLGVTVPRARYAIARLGIDPPIAGRTRLIPVDWVASIKAKLGEDRRHMNGKPKSTLAGVAGDSVRQKAKPRTRERLT